ncbi:MAG: winged helix-turn-helix domain-containing protein [Woeseiaceae bacterium]|nr:winged helix-turn-helix domain-containing protein [Woeseiaceae bacterium]
MNLRNGFTLGSWTVLPLEGRVVGDQGSRAVRPKTMDVLLCLVEAGGDVVERDDLLRKVWGERAVSDEPLTRCIGELRRAFGDARADPEYILTIPKRGYRILKTPGPLRDAPVSTAQTAARPRHSFLRRVFDTVRKPTVALSLLVFAVLAGMAIENVIERIAQENTAKTARSHAERSIAVLPFVDMSPGQDQAYMGDGIAEEVLNLLTGVPGLRVISRSSTFSLRDSAIDVRDVARRFDVSYVLEGSVRKSAERVRITVQLIDGRTDTHVWSDAYDRELHDIFAIQDDIAQAVVSRLQLTILGDAPRSRPTDPEAYSLFLQGRYLHEQPSGDSMQRAMEFYEAALERDPDYVPAWVWLAALYDDTVNSSELPREEVGRLAREAIDRAIAIDGDDPLALGMSAVLAVDWDDDLAKATAQMQRAIDADPGNPILLRWAAIVLTRLGQHAEAVRINEYLFGRDPVGNIAKINLAATYLNAGRYADAVRICQIEVALTDATSPCGSRLVRAYVHSGDAAAALQLLEQRNPSRVYTRLAPIVFHELGRQADFEQALASLQEARAAGDSGLAYWIAYTHAYVGDADAMFDWLERARQDGALNMAPGVHAFVAYADDPRWTQLMERLGKAPADLEALAVEIPPLDPAN